MVILHAADLHLGGSVAAPDGAVAEIAEACRGRVLKRMVELSQKRGVSLVLLAGDVFDSPHPPLAARLALERALAAWRGMGARVFIAPGNHDPFTPDSVWADWPADDNLHIFTPQAQGVALSDAGLWVAGVGHGHEAVTDDLAASLPAPPDGLRGIALLHCALSGAGGAQRHEPYAPASLAELTAAPFALWALGHVHRAGQAAAAPLVLYPGTPQGAHLAEPGERGVYVVEMDQVTMRAEFHPLAGLVFANLALNDLAETSSMSELIGCVAAALDPAPGAWDFARCLRLTLDGPCALASQLWAEGAEQLSTTLKAELGLAGLVLDMSGLYPALESAELAGREDVLGRMLGLIEQAQDDDELLGELAGSLAKKLHPLTRSRDSAQTAEHLRELLDSVRSMALRDLAHGGES